MIGLVIVLANVNGVVMAFSRLVFASARERTLPARLATTDAQGTPRLAIGVTVLAFAAFVVVERVGLLSQATLFELASAAFFAGFVMAAVAYVAESSSRAQRGFGVVVVGLAVVVLVSFGSVALYPVALGALGLVLSTRRGSNT